MRTKCYTEKRFFEWREDDISVSLRARSASYGGGSEVLVVTYQRTSGTLSPGAHAGSYNGQDAYNDMLITDGLLGRFGNSGNADRKECGGGTTDAR